MESLITNMSLGGLLGISLVALYQIAKIHKLLTEVRDSLKQQEPPAP